MWGGRGIATFWGLTLLLGAVACEGDIDTGKDLTVAPDQWVAPDLGQPDSSAQDLSATDTSARDQGPPGDNGPSGDTGAADSALGPCASWSNWTCQPGTTYLCEASCTAGGMTWPLNCINTGHCVCGISTGPCGPFTTSTPCDACKLAVEAGCCK